MSRKTPRSVVGGDFASDGVSPLKTSKRAPRTTLGVSSALLKAKARIKSLEAKILELEDEIHAQYLLNRSAIQRRAWN